MISAAAGSFDCPFRPSADLFPAASSFFATPFSLPRAPVPSFLPFIRESSLNRQALKSDGAKKKKNSNVRVKCSCDFPLYLT